MHATFLHARQGTFNLKTQTMRQINPGSPSIPRRREPARQEGLVDPLGLILDRSLQ